jgi:hypothetical protein
MNTGVDKLLCYLHPIGRSEFDRHIRIEREGRVFATGTFSVEFSFSGSIKQETIGVDFEEFGCRRTLNFVKNNRFHLLLEGEGSLVEVTRKPAGLFKGSYKTSSGDLLKYQNSLRWKGLHVDTFFVWNQSPLFRIKEKGLSDHGDEQLDIEVFQQAMSASADQFKEAWLLALREVLWGVPDSTP